MLRLSGDNFKNIVKNFILTALWCSGQEVNEKIYKLNNLSYVDDYSKYVLNIFVSFFIFSNQSPKRQGVIGD